MGMVSAIGGYEWKHCTGGGLSAVPLGSPSNIFREKYRTIIMALRTTAAAMRFSGFRKIVFFIYHILYVGTT